MAEVMEASQTKQLLFYLTSFAHYSYQKLYALCHAKSKADLYKQRKLDLCTDASCHFVCKQKEREKKNTGLDTTSQ